MGYYSPHAATTPRTKAKVIRVRTTDSLGAINPYLAAINQKFGTSIGVTSSPSPAPSTFSPVSAAPLPSAPVSAPLIVRTLTPTSATTPPTTAPAPPPPPPDTSNPFAPTPPAPSSPPSTPDTSGGGGGAVDTAAQAAAAAAPFVGAIAGPAAGAMAAAAPAFSQAFNAPDTVPISFDTSMPEVYNADGTPATPAAAAAKAKAAPTLVDKFNALPPAAKIGAAVAVYLLFARR